MGKLLSILIVLMVAAIVAGGAFLATWEIPPPESRIERAVADDRLPR